MKTFWMLQWNLIKLILCLPKKKIKKIEETIDEIVDEKKIVLETVDIFVDENVIFEHENKEKEDKKIILILVDRTDTSMDGNTFHKQEAKQDELEPTIPKEENKNDIKIEDVVMKNETLPISEITKENIEEQKLIDEKID